MILHTNIAIGSFFFSSRRRHTRCYRDWSSDVCSSDLEYRVATAFDGREGLEKAHALPPDLILTDVMMPRMRGDELLSELRAHTELATVPVVVLTAKADDDLRVKLLRARAQDFLMKPFSAEALGA